MAFKQPRVPEFNEKDGVSRYLKTLVLFLKDFCQEVWVAIRQSVSVKQLNQLSEQVTNEKTERENAVNQLSEQMVDYRTAVNLLDNSYWKNPKEIVNQRGFVSGSNIPEWGYFIDRWREYDGRSDSTFVFDESGSLVNGSVAQPIDVDKFISGMPYTYAVYFVDGTVIFASGIVTIGNTEWRQYAVYGESNIQVSIFSDSDKTINVSLIDAGSKRIKGHALYEGSYNAKTLPPYRPKGYAAELAECQRYYRFYSNLILVKHASNDHWFGVAGATFDMVANPSAIIIGSILNVASEPLDVAVTGYRATRQDFSLIGLSKAEPSAFQIRDVQIIADL